MFNNTTIFSRFHKNCYICSPKHGKWRSWLARCVRDAEAGCSSHLFPTSLILRTLREVAQLASALRSGRRGRVFESPLPDRASPSAKLFCIKSFVHLSRLIASDDEI